MAPGSYCHESPATLPAEMRTAWERYLHLFARPIDTITPELDIAARLGATFSRSRRTAILSKADGDWRLRHREGEICIVCDEPLHDTDGIFYLRTDHQFERPVMILDGRGMGHYRFIFGTSGEFLCGLVRKNASSSGSHRFLYGTTSSHRRDIVAIAFDPQLRGQTVSSE